MTGPTKEPPQKPTRARPKVEVDPAELAKTVENLRTRAATLRASARWYLISTVSVLVVGVIALGVSGVWFLASTKIDDRVIDTRMRDFDGKTRDVENALSTAIATTKDFAKRAEGLQTLDKDRPRDQAYLINCGEDRFAVLWQQAETAGHQYRSVLDAHAKLREFLQQDLRKDVRVTTDDVGVVLMSTTIIRAGIAALVIFLALFLGNAYRYLTRLSYFYDSRADVLATFGRSDPNLLLMFMTSLNPSEIDFEKTSAPDDELKKAAETLFSKNNT